MTVGRVKYYIKAKIVWAWQQIEVCFCEKYYSRQGCLGLYMVLSIDVPLQRRR